MLCITVLVPRVGAGDRTLLDNGDGGTLITKDTTMLIQETIQRAAFERISQDKRNKLERDDVWVYVIPTHPAPAVKITVEFLDMPGRDWAWQNSLANVIAEAAVTCCRLYANHVVVFTHKNMKQAGFVHAKMT